MGLAACSGAEDSGTEDSATGEASATASDQTSEKNTDETTDAKETDAAEAKSESVFSLNLGDCMMLGDTLSGEVQDLNRTECNKPHNAEIFAQKELADGNFPGTDVAVEESKDYCSQEFGPFVGIPATDSDLQVKFLHPTKDSWDKEDDRRIQCVIIDPKDKVTGSLKDAKR